MEELLQKLLNEVVVTPFDEDVSGRLTAVGDSFVEDVAVQTIDRYVRAFVMNRPDMELKEEIEKKYEEMYPEEEPIEIPPLFTIVISQYIVIKAITEKIDGQDQAVTSLIVMNYMLYRKGSLTRLILPNHVKELYYKLDEYIEQEDDIAENRAYKYIGDILANKAFLDENYQDEDVKREVREMAKMAYLYQKKEIVEKYKKDAVGSLYVKVYNYLNDILTQTKWYYVNNDVVKLLKEVLSEEERKKAATIESVVNELDKENVHLPNETLEESSLLLRYVQKVEPIPNEIRQRRLTVMEFGVYVYYELLLERIIGTYYGE